MVTQVTTFFISAVDCARMKIIEVIADAGHTDTITGIVEQYEIHDHWLGPVNEDGRVASRILVSDEQRQKVLDSLQTMLGTSDNARIMVIPLEVALPEPVSKADDEKKRKKRAATISREELYRQVEQGAQLNSNFILYVVLSSIVAAIGMLENNVAVIIGAMVIAPLLGPNIALSLGTSLGDRVLVGAALRSLLCGTVLAVLTGYAVGMAWNDSLDSLELMLRTDVHYSGTAIALASGAAASLSLVSSVSSVLVGVMVAVALMPPAVAMGIMLSVPDMDSATGAALLLALNIVCINLSAKLVFLYRGIRPRTWIEARKARQSRTLYILFWVILLILSCAMIWLKQSVR